MPLVMLIPCYFEPFQVGEKVIEPKEGEAFVWDHSYEHEAGSLRAHSKVLIRMRLGLARGIGDTSSAHRGHLAPGPHRRRGQELMKS